MLLAASAAAGQAVTTLGSSAAQACYEAARDQRATAIELSICNGALGEMLTLGDRVATHVNRGIVHALRGEYPEALADYDKAISLDPTEAEAFLNKALLLLRLPRRERQVLELADLALAKKTSKPAVAHVARAVANERLGDLEAAYRDFQQAAVLDPAWGLPARELRRFRKKS